MKSTSKEEAARKVRLSMSQMRKEREAASGPHSQVSGAEWALFHLLYDLEHNRISPDEALGKLGTPSP